MRATVADEVAVAVPAVPYRGIQPFRYVDHAIFFVREEEEADLLRLILVYRGVMLYGDSGAGKSSLINAGVLPAARARGFQPERIRVQPQPGEELVVERIALKEDGGFLPSLFASGDQAATPLSIEAFEERLRAASGSSRPLLVFDQFEELVTLFGEAGQCDLQRRIVELVVALLRDDRLPVKLLFAFREDYLASVKHLLAEVPELVDQALRLSPPAAGELTTIIRGPFEEHPGHFERELSPELAERLRDRLADRFGTGDMSLSEVQTVCLRLWQADDPDALLEARGVQGLLEDYLGEELEAFPPTLKYPAVALLGQMVTEAGTRNVLSAESLIDRVREEEKDISSEQLEHALDRLESESKLVRRERRRDLYLYEITSEFLVPWISRQREELVRSQERRRERRRLLIAGSAVVLVAVFAVVGTLAGWALVQRSDAKRAESSAASLALAIASNEQRSSNLNVSLMLGLEAVRAKASRDARSSLLSSLEIARRSGATGLLRSPQGPVWRVVFSPDGSTLASAGYDGTVRLWSVATHELIGDPLSGHTRYVTGVAFSPNGRVLASSSADRTVRLWDVDSQQAISVLRGHKGPARSVAFSPDGTLASAGDDGKVRLWDIASGSQVGLLRHESPIHAVEFSPDGRILASVGDDETVRLWNAKTLDQLGKPLRHKVDVFAVTFSPDGGTLVSASEDAALLWNVATHDLIGKLPAYIVLDVAFSPDGRTLAISGYSRVRWWDARSLKPIGEPLYAHDALDLEISPDGRTLATSGYSAVRLWEIADAQRFGEPLPAKGRSPAGPVLGVAFSPDGQTIVSVGVDRTIRLWDAHSREPLGRPLRAAGARWAADGRCPPPPGYARGAGPVIAFNPNSDAHTLVTAGEGMPVQFWRIPSQQSSGERLRGQCGSATAVAFSSDGRILATASTDSRLRLWDARSFKPLGAPLGGPGAVAGGLSVTFSPDGQTLATSGGESGDLVQLWDVESRQPLGAPLDGHTDDVTIVSFNPDGRLLASGSFDGTVQLWDVRSRKPLATLGRKFDIDTDIPPVYAVAFSPDGQTLATAGADKVVRLWDVATHKPLGEPLRGHERAILSVAFGPEGRTLVSTAGDGTVRLWEGILWHAVDDGDYIARSVCYLAGGKLSRAEWEEVAAGIDYRSSCP